MLLEVAREFWRTRTEPPKFGDRRRRLLELDWVVPRLAGRSVVDVGCGDGWAATCLAHLTDLHVIACDMLPVPELDPRIERRAVDLAVDVPPGADNALLFGVVQYLPDDRCRDLFARLDAGQVFVRSPCASGDHSFEIDDWSDHLGARYASRYRTPGHLGDLISAGFDIIDAQTIYPIEMDSQWGTRTWMVHGVRR